MLNPAEPNTTRKIHITYTTDAQGDMEVSIDAAGFEEDPRAVPLFIAATLAAIDSEK